MKKILGLDLGTNSIGWALIQQDFEKKQGKILGIGSRIIPMSQDILGEFGKGNSVSQTAERTGYRSMRRLRERHLLRRERLHRVLNILGFLPQHYANQIDFNNRLGQFTPESEPKLAYNNKEFIFKKAFNEMLEDFQKSQQHILKNEKGEAKLVPYDWTIYYLRKKALNQKIGKEELAWILLNFNQKRGYYQLRGEEEEENPNKLVEFHSLKIVEVQANEKQRGKDETWYSLILENGWVYRRPSKTPLFDWKGKVRDFIVTTDLNDDGTIKKDKEGNEKRSFRAPSEDDWTLVKKKTEQEINQSKKTVGAYIYDTLLQNPKQKIKGKLVRTIERKFYKSELKAILKKQNEFHPELQNEDAYNDCVRELYKNNEAHQLSLSKRDFIHLFLDDIIFYHRPLKSQKSFISDCSLEYRPMKNKDGKLLKDENGKQALQPLKAISKSHPLYQEFRLWQWMYNLNIYKKEEDANVTPDFLNSTETYEKLFEFLNDRKEVDQKALLKHFKLNDKTHRWNFVEDKTYPCNETGTQIKIRLEKVENVPDNFLTAEIEQHLWHIIYSVTDKTEYEKALKTFAKKHQLDTESFVDSFKKFPPFKSEYGSYSAKAIKKLLPLMKIGKYWNWDNVNIKAKERIDKILSGEFDEDIKNRVREKSIHLTEQSHFQGLQLWLASYIVYGHHSEAAIAGKWNSEKDLEKFLGEFKQHSLRNPIVEQVVTETLRVVKDIWVKYGNGAKDYFDEIHIELGREMKNTSEDRKKISNQVTENENTNLRIKALLAEMLNDSHVKSVRPHSPYQQDALKIFEEYALNNNERYDEKKGEFVYDPITEDIEKISKMAQPTKSELLRYKLWLEQRYRSPYTGAVIPLNRLFTTDYQIEHIIPQSLYFDDSFNNKVICESAVNDLKENKIGLAFIKSHHGEKVQLGLGKTVQIFEVTEYEDFVKQHYTKNRSKRNKLLLEDVPEKMIERQINDTRYITKFISSVLSNIVRSEVNDDGINSKNVIPGNGKITSTLKQDWGLSDVWNDLILPRFERMNALTNSNEFTAYNEKYQKYLPTVPIGLSKGFQKKRIDHRHHALDALVIACATRDHINLLNNKHAKSNERFDLNRKLRKFKKVSYLDKKASRQVEKEVPKDFLKPWSTFTVDARNGLETIVVSFKQNTRVINKTGNKYQSYKDENGNIRIGKDGKPVKDFISQTKGDSWAIRKSMHQDTVAGLIKLRKAKTVSLPKALDEVDSITDKSLKLQIKKLIKDGLDKKKITKHFKDLNNQWNNKDISKVEIFYWEVDEQGNGINAASRVSLDTSFNEKKIKSITDTGIQKILLNHLRHYAEQKDEKGKEIPPESLAFSPEGIEEMNRNIATLNNGKFHQPILKVRTYEPKGNKFNVGQTGNKKDKFVIAAQGTNLFFAIYENENGERNYETIPLNEVIEHQKWRATLTREEQENTPLIPVKAEKGNFLFSLSPNDLVYIPSEDEKENSSRIDFSNLTKEQVARIYKFTDSSDTTGNFVPATVSSLLFNIPKKEQEKRGISYLIQNEYGLGSPQSKNQKSIDGIMIKDYCIKLKVGRLGDIVKNGGKRVYTSSSENIEVSQVTEPQIAYSGSKNITISNSSEEAESYQIGYWSGLSPEQRFSDFFELMNRFYNFNKPDWSIKKIIIDL